MPHHNPCPRYETGPGIKPGTFGLADECSTIELTLLLYGRIHRNGDTFMCLIFLWVAGEQRQSLINLTELTTRYGIFPFRSIDLCLSDMIIRRVENLSFPYFGPSKSSYIQCTRRD